jgi:hypothetical protein
MGSNVITTRIEQSLRELRTALDGALPIGERAQEERDMLERNPDAHRGDMTVREAEAAIAERATEQVARIDVKVKNLLASASVDLGDLTRRTHGYASSTETANAWQSRVRPLLERNAPDRVAAFLAAQDDRDGLNALHANVASYIASKFHGDPASDTALRAVREALAAVEDVQESSGLVDPDVFEFRRLHREYLALNDDAGATIVTALTAARRALRTEERMALGIRRAMADSPA